MIVNFAEHLLKGTHVPNIIVYVFAIIVFTLLFAVIIAKDMDSKEEEDCFDEKIQAKIAAFNAATTTQIEDEEPTKEQVEELYEELATKEVDSDESSDDRRQSRRSEEDSYESSEDEVNLPDILLIVRAKYRDAEKLLANRVNRQIEVQDVKFLDFYPSLYTNIPQNLKKIRRNSL
jgi:hypothetical protein